MVCKNFDYVFSVLYSSLRNKLGKNLEKNILYVRICFLCFIVRYFFTCICLRIVLTRIFGFIFFVLQDKSSIDPFPIPLAIIGGKYDIYQVSSESTPGKI